MFLRHVLVWLRRVIVICAVATTTYLYLYPIWFGCAFPSTVGSVRDGFRTTIRQHTGHVANKDPALAPFRLLVLADPQLEGDSSLPDPEDALLARLRSHVGHLRNTRREDVGATLGKAWTELVFEDIPRSLWAVRKTLDLFGNDYYLAHIYRTLHWWTKPTHVTVLGDLIGSQWVSDDEFEWRTWRYWNRVFSGSRIVDEDVMAMHDKDRENRSSFELESDDRDWSEQVINIAGNHDIGYAGDITRERIERFEKAYGRMNWDIKFTYPEARIPESHRQIGLATPKIHLIVLNSMLLDTPALDESLMSDNFNWINGLIGDRLDAVEARNTSFTLLLTHVPLHKPEGVCVDGPFFDFWDHRDAGGAFKKGGLKEQNHLSDHASQNGMLQGIFGMNGGEGQPIGGKGRRGLLLNGHDHEGCDSVHYIERTTTQHQPDEVVSSEVSEHEKTENDAESIADATSVSWKWKTVRTADYEANVVPSETGNNTYDIVTSLREITLRSMMGHFSGNAGLLSLWYDFEAGHWHYEMTMCPLGVQHTWWAIHVIDIVAVCVVVCWPLVEYLITQSAPTTQGAQKESKADGGTNVTTVGAKKSPAELRKGNRTSASETKHCGN